LPGEREQQREFGACQRHLFSVFIPADAAARVEYIPLEA